MALFHFLKFVCFILSILIVSHVDTNAGRNTPNSSPAPSPSPSPNLNSSMSSSIPTFDYINYLKKYGYMDYARDHVQFGASYDEILKMAISTFQMNYGLSRTGELNYITMFTMLIPRCGVPDITDSINSMIFSNRNPNTNPNFGSNSSKKTDIVSHYDYFRGRPKWSYFHLSYRYIDGFPERAKVHIERAFARWANVSDFSFYEHQDFFGSDISIGYYSLNHGDGSAFDGPLGVLAHAFPPDDGRLHFDADENWSFAPTTIDFFDFETAAMHEIGHILGLDHSSERDAIMFSALSMHEIRDLDEDDIDGIAMLYPPPF